MTTLGADHSATVAPRPAVLQKGPFLLLGFGLLLILLLSLFVGRYPAPYWMSPETLWQDEMAWQLVFNLRLPRVLTACLLGMTLAASG
ncbi:MAG: iron chelate uptake ABC transporter family permease subunit, partial [Anaerolineae bacterium]